MSDIDAAEFDTVIVGAGSAGCVLARRLIEAGRRKVLLLEAGGSERKLWTQLPIGYGKTFYDPRVNWMYRTEPEPALAGREGYWPRGKVLGGSSSINAMVYVRGQPGDFDDWEAAGNPGWGWRDVAPYFRKMEDFAGGADEWRGAGGPLHVADVSAECHPLCDAYLTACEEIGLARTRDFNGASFEGVGFYQITMKGGLRMSAARAYLRPAMRAGALAVETHAQVTRVLVEGGRAVGVEYARDGTHHVVRAGREVVLCAGSIATPQLLQLSGIGPMALLREHGIAVLRDSPAVGRNLQDHLCIDHLYRARLPTLNQVLGTWRGRVAIALRYAVTRRGPLSISVNQGGGFIRLGAGAARPNAQLYFSPVSYTRAMPGKRALMRPDPFPGFLLSAQPCRPTSRGHIAIRSADPFAPPAIVPNSLATEADIVEMLACTRFLRTLSAAPSLVAITEREMAPGPAVTTEAEFLDDIRQRASTVFHPIGTCAMGPDAAASVVDASLRVHGLAALRVVDASVFPNLTSGNTNAPTIMLAEKGADLLLREPG